MLKLLFLISLLFILPAPNLHAKDSLKNIEIAVGEYKPFVSEFVEGHGELTEKVTAILNRMGFSPTYVFMPWGQAEEKVKFNQKNKGLRATFPYIKNDKREKEFIYPKKPIRQACISIFYNKEKVSISHPEFSESHPLRVSLDDLKTFKLGSIKSGEGYEYPEDLKSIFQEQKHNFKIKKPEETNTFKSAFKLFKALIDSEYKIVEAIPFEKRVGLEILYDLFPETRSKIGLIKNKNAKTNDSCFEEEGSYFIVSRKNPENVEFINDFDKAHEGLGEEALERIRRKVEERSSGQKPNVILNVHDISLPIIGYDENGKVYILPRGTMGELLKWTQFSEDSSDTKDNPKAEAKVFVLTGPYRGKNLRLDGKFIELVR